MIAWAEAQTNTKNSLLNIFNEAITQLGALRQDRSPNIEVRLGGIYALKNLAQENK